MHKDVCYYKQDLKSQKKYIRDNINHEAIEVEIKIEN